LNFFILKQKIIDKTFLDSSGVEYYSDLYFEKATLLDRLKSSLPKKYKLISIKEDTLLSIEKDLNGIFWCDSVVPRIISKNDLFLEKLYHAHYDLFIGDNSSFVFKGSLSKLQEILLNEINDVLFKEFEINLLKIRSLSDYIGLNSNKSHMRFFNFSEVTDKEFIKKSTNIEKIKAEFNFLNSIPEDLSDYFVKVSNLKENKKYAQYSMPKVFGIDSSILLLNHSFDNDLSKYFFNTLTDYFTKVLTLGPLKDKAYDASFIVSKNNDRIKSLEKWEFYCELNSFIANHTQYSGIHDLRLKINELVLSHKKFLDGVDSYLSHGDLCLSNIMIEQPTLNIKLIDPRGELNENSPFNRSLYYDLAKLAHSIIGGYDLIINNRAKIIFNQNMEASISFDNFFNEVILKEYKKMIDFLGFDYEIINIVQASLFLSMLPLHVENKKKVFILALRSSEICSRIHG